MWTKLSISQQVVQVVCFEQESVLDLRESLHNFLNTYGQIYEAQSLVSERMHSKQQGHPSLIPQDHLNGAQVLSLNDF